MVVFGIDPLYSKPTDTASKKGPAGSVRIGAAAARRERFTSPFLTEVFSATFRGRLHSQLYSRLDGKELRLEFIERCLSDRFVRRYASVMTAGMTPTPIFRPRKVASTVETMSKNDAI